MELTHLGSETSIYNFNFTFQKIHIQDFINISIIEYFDNYNKRLKFYGDKTKKNEILLSIFSFISSGRV